MLSTLEAEDGEFYGDLKFTADEVLCDMNIPGKGREPHRKVIDYIFYKGNGYKPADLKRYVKQYKYQWCDRHSDLSDHLGVLMEVAF